MKKNKRLLLIWILGPMISLMILGLCLVWGSVSISFHQVYLSLVSLFKEEWSGLNPSNQTIILAVRLPRILNAFLIGAGLSLAGLTMQSLLKNPLADGSTLGVSSGAALGAGLAILYFPHFSVYQFDSRFILAATFAFISLLLVLTFTRLFDQRLSHQSLILVGIIFSMLVSAGLNLLLLLAKDQLQTLVFWTLGSLSATTYHDACILAFALVINVLFLYRYSQDLNALALGGEQARNLGVNVYRVRLLLLILVSIQVGLSVAVAGSIAFVGLIIPHMSRMIVGSNHRYLVAVSLFLGGNFLAVADLVARTLIRPLEIPIGIITSIIGTLIFFYLLVKRTRGGVC